MDTFQLIIILQLEKATFVFILRIPTYTLEMNFILNKSAVHSEINIQYNKYIKLSNKQQSFVLLSTEGFIYIKQRNLLQ